MKPALFIGPIISLVASIGAAGPRNERAVYGDWMTTEATATLDREGRRVDYARCALRFRFYPADRTGRSVRIEALSAKCTHPEYWDFSPFLPPGVIRLPKDASDGFKTKLEADGSVDFLTVRREGAGISLEWSERSFDDLNFDLSSGPMRPVRLRRVVR